METLEDTKSSIVPQRVSASDTDSIFKNISNVPSSFHSRAFNSKSGGDKAAAVDAELETMLQRIEKAKASKENA